MDICNTRGTVDALPAFKQVGVALSTVSWLACEGDSAPRAPPATEEAVVPRCSFTDPASSLTVRTIATALILSPT
ncbi:hypothetical protein RR46_07643 [Papilio xuthus]|uniref:Uncharacterized protein n=1 Tax=Papilio xuthus TaxID=66420 RepID=A0A194Q615_PAPXU|nr:hypothetical protein RR46_07643 [Papilio xuthus]